MLSLRKLQSPLQFIARATRSNSTIAGCLYYRISYHDSKKTGLVAPHEGVKWSYGEFWSRVERAAGGLKSLGYQPGSVIATDLTNSVANVLLQLAVAHNGMQLLTVKSKEELDRLAPMLPVMGAVMTDSSSFLQSASFDIKTIDAASFKKLEGKAGEGATDRNADHAYYSSENPNTNREIYLHGVGTAGLLETQPEDSVCVAANLNHPYGMGMVMSAIVRNAAIYLPDMANPEVADCTLLATDKHHLQTLAGTVKADAPLRGGIVKVGSGTDVLGKTGHPAKEPFAGTELFAVGSGEPIFRPLFDSCVDKYYSYK